MQFDFLSKAAEHETYTVSKLNREVRSLLENSYDGIWVEAEVSEVSSARSGHVYFTLTDPGGKASISAVMWRGVASRYGSRIQKGNGVLCHGRVTLYENRGSYQLVVDRAREAGEGLRAKKLALLREKLLKEGLFDPERKRPLPSFPERVGVVTSRDGAAFRDIIKVLFRRFPVVITLSHAQVQGSEAPGEIVKALNLLSENSKCDVIIVGRGGGSAEDLDAFNSEEVVRTAASCPVPVISAVGHEIDTTLLDLVADQRAATPSEAAEMAVPERELLLEELEGIERGLEKALRWQMGEEREKISDLLSRLRAKDPRVSLKRGIEVLALAQKVFASWPERSVERARMEIDDSFNSLVSGLDSVFKQVRERFLELTVRLDALSPLASLSRGYAVVRETTKNTIITEASQAPSGSEVDITLARGRLLCDVKDSFDKNES